MTGVVSRGLLGHDDLVVLEIKENDVIADDKHEQLRMVCTDGNQHFPLQLVSRTNGGCTKCKRTNHVTRRQGAEPCSLLLVGTDLREHCRSSDRAKKWSGRDGLTKLFKHDDELSKREARSAKVLGEMQSEPTKFRHLRPVGRQGVVRPIKE